MAGRVPVISPMLILAVLADHEDRKAAQARLTELGVTGVRVVSPEEARDIVAEHQPTPDPPTLPQDVLRKLEETTLLAELAEEMRPRTDRAARRGAARRAKTFRRSPR